MKAVPIVLSIIISGIASCNNRNDTSVNMSSPESKNGYAQINGLHMYYEIHGEGKPIVLVHGGGSTIQTTFGVILPLLAKTYKVIAVELQAHGHTSDRDSPESFEQDADDVAGLLRHLKIDRADIIGFSNGGNTGMQMAIRHPDLVNKIIIIAAIYKRSGMVPGFFEGMENATLENMPAYLKEAFLEINPDSASLQTMFDKDRNRMLHFKDWREDDLAGIKAPVLLVAGDKDVVTTEHIIEMSRIFPHCELLILPGTHGSYIGEGMKGKETGRIPALAVAVFQEFLDK